MRRLSPIIIVLLLAACGGGEAETATTAAPDPTTTTEAPTTTAEPTTTTTEAPTTTVAATTTTAEPSAEECLVGTWELDSEAFVASLMSEMGSDMPGEITSGGGSYVVEMGADGSFTSTRDEWRYLIESPQGTLAAQIDGTESGTYETADDTLTVSIADGEATVSMGLLVDGELQELPFGSAQTIDAQPLSGSGTYQCDTDTLTVSTTAEGPSGEPLEFESIFNRR